ncbi:Pac1p, partial [Ascoidea rubescens DSM 1968]
LTIKQQNDLNRSIIIYLKNRDIDQELIDELIHNLSFNNTDFDLIASSEINLLEKKWSTVIRLQKKILELENKVNQLNEILNNNNFNNNITDSFSSLTTNDNNDLSSLKKINWLPTNVKQTLKAHKSQVNTISIHPILPQLVSGCNDGSLIVWDLLNSIQPEFINKNAHSRSINCTCFSPLPISLTSLNNSSNSSSNSIQNNDSNGLKNSSTFSKNQIYLFATCSSDLFIKIWDPNNDYKPIRTLSGHDHSISSISFKNSNPNHLFSCSRDFSIKLWDITNGWCLKSFIGHSNWVRSINLNYNDNFLLSCSNDQSIRLSHSDTGTGLALLIGHHQVVEDCKFVPEISNVYLDKLAKKFVSKEILDNQNYKTLGYKYCATCGRDDTIKIWLLPLPIIRPHRSPLPSSNPTGVLLADLKGHSSWVRSLQFHPGGRYLFSASDDKTIKIWDISLTNYDVIKCIKTLSGGHESFINKICFASSNGSTSKESKKEAEKQKRKLIKLDKSIRCTLASGGADNTVCIWA